MILKVLTVASVLRRKRRLQTIDDHATTTAMATPTMAYRHHRSVSNRHLRYGFR
ncbi:hypothetical protein HanXRQr2_Chr17g0800571 [Helianthus annuus]|uniref:Uncharacterized protein n=1 Tax=Helianthus annuus TaxID=4232 RepID=A0A251RPH9_HELAN|nr:hypothetical protein HanXRQr2_Chr17g0800571 [Helianthus annuus]KAJ0812983.1 hypothetical protein HanPSC8_Chr17g0768211 [Helianthus annuus]